jgi:phosphate transport system substrate-binding protein
MRRAIGSVVRAGVALSLASGLLVGASGCPKKENKLNIGGATFIQPMMTKWSAEYNKAKSVEVSYNGVGSGAGINNMIEKTYDFGCSDAPMNEEQLKKAKENGGDVVHIPLAMGAVVPIYNLEGIDKPLRFTGEVLAKIYLGQIKKWNEKELDDLQEDGVKGKLPDKEIVVVHRSDGSGTTYIFADFLAKKSKDWAEGPKVGTTLKWPTGVGQKGNDGVADHVKKSPGAIGYVELIYAVQNSIKFGAVQNKEKKWILASLEGVTAAAAAKLEQKDIPDDLRYSLTDAPGAESYPIAGTNWAIVYVDPGSAAKGKAIYDFLWWVTHDGQGLCKELHYARLPPELVTRLEARLNLIKK